VFACAKRLRTGGSILERAWALARVPSLGAGLLEPLFTECFCKNSLQSMGEVFQLEVDQVRALSHPLRLRILNVLAEEGPATSTTLARTLGENTAATSYHLRQLAQYGLIRELPQRGNGRDRWWEALAASYGAKVPTSNEARSAGYALAARVVEHDAQVVRAYLDSRETYPAAWQDAALFTNASIWATPDELHLISQRLHQVLSEYRRPAVEDRPKAAERVYVVLRAVPWSHELADQSGDGAEQS
jgi:DNA-binding transcriptional ArsR family regulator